MHDTIYLDQSYFDYLSRAINEVDEILGTSVSRPTEEIALRRIRKRIKSLQNQTYRPDLAFWSDVQQIILILDDGRYWFGGKCYTEAAEIKNIPNFRYLNWITEEKIILAQLYYKSLKGDDGQV